MTKIIATRPVSTTTFHTLLHGDILQRTIMRVLCQIDDNYYVYEAEKTVTLKNGVWMRQISVETPASEAILKEFGL